MVLALTPHQAAHLAGLWLRAREAERRYREAVDALVAVPPGGNVHLDAAAGTLAVTP